MTRQRQVLSPLSLTVWAVLCLVAAVMMTAPGCSGCRKEKDKDAAAKKKDEKDGEKDKKKEEKPKRDFDVEQLRLQPTDETTAQLYVKPGHYVQATQDVIANNFDFSADLHTASVDKSGNPLAVPQTPFAMEATRPAALPKGNIKRLEASYFVPRMTTPQTVWLKSELRSKGGRRMVTRIRPTLRMAPHQFRFLVLSDHADRYGYLKAMDAVDAPWREFDSTEARLHFYRVLLPTIEDHVPLPSDSFSWTSIAYLLWDKMDGERLTSRQKQSLIDWLHFGGQLIISGPETLEDMQVKGRFLADLLPAKAGKTEPFAEGMLDDLNAAWSVSFKNKPQLLGPLEDTAALPSLIELQLDNGGEFVPNTNNRVAERHVGRGRIVVTSFALSERWVTNWRGFDQFLHCCLMRRPARVFAASPPYFLWKDYTQGTRDSPALVSNLRYFTRDMGSSAAAQLKNRSNAPQQLRDDESMRFGGFTTSIDAGVAGWSDTNTVAEAARQSVRDAAGINVPKADFVFKMLAIYLLILVPVNWGLFRLIRRVEWAWVAAPLIAIGGAFAVVRLAQLDIGFARSQTEVAVIEGYGGFERAHLTRYTAVYTSLSTTYDFRFESDSAVAQPFPTRTGIEPGVQDVVHFRRDAGMSLSGFRVESSKTGMIHSEQMYPLGGAITLAGTTANPQIKNGTDLDLKGVGILFRTSTDRLQTAWIGELNAHTSKPLNLLGADKPWLSQWSKTPELVSMTRDLRLLLTTYDKNNNKELTREEIADHKLATDFNRWDLNADDKLNELEIRQHLTRNRAGSIRLGELLDLAAEVLVVRRGEMRLIGWTDKRLQGMQVTPAASQVEAKTLVLMHLNPAPYPEPARDQNLAAEIVPALDAEIIGEPPDGPPVGPFPRRRAFKP